MFKVKEIPGKVSKKEIEKRKKKQNKISQGRMKGDAWHLGKIYRDMFKDEVKSET